MWRIWKYPIPVADDFTLDLPRHSRLLHVAEQDGQPMLWVLVDPGQPEVARQFRIFGTGNAIRPPADGERLDHVGTWLSKPFVWHLFELVESEEA